MTRPTCVVVLAAGEGTRMRSARPKPLHKLCGRTMASFVLEAARHDEVRSTVVVVGHHATWVEKELAEGAGAGLTFVEQGEPLGTGHAVAAALATVDEAIGESDGDVVILPGDTPLLRRETVARLLEEHRASGAALTVMSAVVPDPRGYGRVVTGRDGTLERIVEERDASPAERLIDEVNTGVMVVRQSLLGPALRRVGRQNAQGEYYLTDVVAVLSEMGHATRSFVLADPSEALGVNDRAQLARAEAELRRRINDQWMGRGVTLWDPATTYLDVDVSLAADVSILPGTILQGRTRVGAGAIVGPRAHLVDVEVGERARVGCVEASAVRIGPDAKVRSFVTLGPGEDVAAGALVAPGG